MLFSRKTQKVLRDNFLIKIGYVRLPSPYNVLYYKCKSFPHWMLVLFPKKKYSGLFDTSSQIIQWSCFLTNYIKICFKMGFDIDLTWNSRHIITSFYCFTLNFTKLQNLDQESAALSGSCFFHFGYMLLMCSLN